MLTLERVKDFKTSLELMVEECTDLLRTRERERAFASIGAAERERPAARRYPSDYYFFRDYEVQISLRIDRSHNYYVYVENSFELCKRLKYPTGEDYNKFLVGDTVKAIFEYTSQTEDPEKEVIENIREVVFNEAVAAFNKIVYEYVFMKFRPNELSYGL